MLRLRYIRISCVQHISRISKDTLLQLLPAFLQGHTGYIGLTRRISASIKGRCVSILCRLDEQPVVGDPGNVRRYLREDGVSALPYLGSSHKNLRRTIRVQHHAGRSCLQRNRMDSRLITEDRHADAPAHRPCLILV